MGNLAPDSPKSTGIRVAAGFCRAGRGDRGRPVVPRVQPDRPPRGGRPRPPIVALDTEAPALSAGRGAKTRAYALDLTDPKADARLAEILTAERVDTLVHLAFLPTPSHAAAWAHELESVGTRHTMVAARHAQVRKVVLVADVLYGAHPTNPNFLTERHPLRAARKEPFFADKNRGRGGGHALRRAGARVGRDDLADGADARTDGAELPDALPRRTGSCRR